MKVGLVIPRKSEFFSELAFSSAEFHGIPSEKYQCRYYTVQKQEMDMGTCMDMGTGMAMAMGIAMGMGKAMGIGMGIGTDTDMKTDMVIDMNMNKNMTISMSVSMNEHVPYTNMLCMHIKMVHCACSYSCTITWTRT
jgi:hypothetical protein